jgi:hypothetical protein
MEMSEKTIPEEFIQRIFKERVSTIRKIIQKELSDKELYMEFMRHTLIVATNGPAGLNAAVKGVGLVVKEDILPRILSQIKDFAETNPSRRKVLKFLLENLYVKEKLDFKKLSSLELAKKHTYQNLIENKHAVLVFFIPPITSYEVKCRVEIHLNDLYHEYVNAVHDLFHKSKIKKEWSKTPAYIFHIEEIYDNSANKMGVKIY